jgi:glutamyl-tRNA reductase
MQRLLLLGLNHSTAPLEVREKVAFSSADRERALEALRAKFSEAEVVILSTCNRVEVYAAREVHGHPRAEEIVAFLAEFHRVDPAVLRSHVYEKTDRDAVAHLFAVASSLDSMVLGETQILGQVREAYDVAREKGGCGAILNPLFQRALAVGKEVLGASGIAEGRVSIASVAVDYARRIFDSFADKTVLSIGAGKMASLVLQSFAALKPKRLLVCNRNVEKAVDLAKKFGGEAMAFERLGEHLVAADIVVSGTGATQPIITAGLVGSLRKRRRYRPIFVIDIAMPRDVEAAVGELENVYLYNIDDLQQVVAETISQRTDAIDAARTIVARHVEGFVAWHRAREMGPMIDRLAKRYHALAAEELARTINKLPNLSEAERSHLEELTRRIVNKLLHDPVTMLRKSEGMHGTSAQYLHALERLFHLEDREEGMGLTDSDAT